MRLFFYIYKAAYRATTHLIHEGYRKIIHYGGPQHLSSYRRRHDGYKDALLDNGLEYTKDRVVENVISREKGAWLTERLIRKKLDFDAIFAASDMISRRKKMQSFNFSFDFSFNFNKKTTFTYTNFSLNIVS